MANFPPAVHWHVQTGLLHVLQEASSQHCSLQQAAECVAAAHHPSWK